MVMCSCPYYPTHGIPCRHFCVFSQVLLHHIHVRWRLDFDANYGDRQAHNWKEWRSYFKQRMRSNQLVISKSEYEAIMDRAKQWTKPEEQPLFNQPKSRMYQKNKDGILTYVDSMRKNRPTENILLGSLEEELHLPRLLSGDDDSDSEDGSSRMPILGANPYNNVVSMYSSVSEVYAESPDKLASINGELMTYFGRLLKSAREQQGSQESYLGEYVDLFAETEKRKVGVRLKSSSEPKRSKKRRSRKLELTFEDSLVS